MEGQSGYCGKIVASITFSRARARRRPHFERNDMSDSNNASGGIGFIGLLTIAFIVLKLTSHIDWSWLWVLSPLWIGVGFVLAVLAFFGLAALILFCVHAIIRKMKR